MELRFTFKGESTHCPCRQCQPSIRCITRNIFLLVKPHPSCYACNVFSNFSFFKGDASYFSDMLSHHVPGTGLGYLPRLAQTLTTILQVTIKFILQMSKLTGPGLPSQQVVESKFNYIYIYIKCLTPGLCPSFITSCLHTCLCLLRY